MTRRKNIKKLNIFFYLNFLAFIFFISIFPSHALIFNFSKESYPPDIPNIIKSQYMPLSVPTLLVSIFKNTDITFKGKSPDYYGWQWDYYLERDRKLGRIPKTPLPKIAMNFSREGGKLFPILPNPQKYTKDKKYENFNMAACPEPTSTTAPIVYKGVTIGDNLGYWRLVTVNIDGSGYTFVNNTNACVPRWTREGNKILAVQPCGCCSIYTVNPDGTGETILANNAVGPVHPRYSADGNLIAYFGAGNQIWRMNADGSAQVALTSLGDNRRAEWSPDGTKIAFQSSRTGTWQIYTMDLNGSNQTQLTFAGSNQRARWSPDSATIAFYSTRDGNTEVYIMNRDGSGQFRVTNNGATDYNPRFIVDSTKLVFFSDRTGTWDIVRINIDGTGEVNLTNTANTEYYGMRWAPDLNKIIYEQNIGNWEVYTMNYDGTGQTNITNTGWNELDFKWSGSWIFDSF